VPVPCLAFDDLGWAIAELHRTRALGCRAFTFPMLTDGRESLAHPRFDHFWQTVVELGMVPVLHAGIQPVFGDLAWGRIDEGPYRVATLAGMAGELAHHAPETALVALCTDERFFEVHPDLVFLVAGWGADWYPYLLERSEFANTILVGFIGGGPWKGRREITEYMRDHFRVAAAPDEDLAQTARLASGVVFSSQLPDSPVASPVHEARAALRTAVDLPTRQAFFGASLHDLLGR
jgi:predicted TIM-barrel fold metal-dependent hydrolase